MKILVTGSNGFIGKHICLRLKRLEYTVFEYDLSSSDEELLSHIKSSDFIIHLAGINRPKKDSEFYEGNTNFTAKLVDLLGKNEKKTPIIMSSSIQAELDNEYGKSKKLAEEALLNSSLPVYVYRLANVFGKWAKPNYNSACATFCYNIAHNLPIEVRDPKYIIKFNYIDDVCDEFIRVINGDWLGSRNTLSVSPIYECSLGHLSELLYYFKGEIESDRHLPIIKNEFELKLFKTFCDYLSDEGYSFNYFEDGRGSFEEVYKSKKWGQISDNVIFPGIIKGGHYHTYKKEIFYTVIGESEIKQRNIVNNERIVDVVNGDEPTPIDIRVNYTHQIKNIGNVNSHTLMWISEIYCEDTADTYKEEV